MAANNAIGVRQGNAPEIAYLVVGGNELAGAGLIHNHLQRAVLQLPGQDVAFYTILTAVRIRQLQQNRPSYTNGVLIQSRGQVDGPCTHCVKPGSKPFPVCHRVPGHFGGACGNCKYLDWASTCSVRDEVVRDDDSDDNGGPPDDDDDDDGKDDKKPKPKPHGKGSKIKQEERVVDVTGTPYEDQSLGASAGNPITVEGEN